MVLSNQVREILIKQHNINSFKNNYKSLIPSNDIPDVKRVYHDNMKKTVEKTINLKKSNKKNKLEVIVTKDEFSLDEIIEMPPEEDEEDKEEPGDKNEIEEKNITFFDIEESEDEDNEEGRELEENKEEGGELEENKEEDKKEDKEDKEEIDLLNMIDNKLLLDIINGKKGNKSDNKLDSKSEKERIIIEDVKKENVKKEDPNTKTINFKESADTLEQSGGIKKIKLDQKYDFF